MNKLSMAIQISRDAAKNLLNKYHTGGKVEIENIGEKIGINIEEGTFSKNDISGIMKRNGKNGKPIIVVNTNESNVRKRFTIAHEIGHFILHTNELLHVDTIFKRDSKSALATSIMEIQANQFAAELLMPTDELTKETRKLVENGKNAEQIAQELATQYEVSSEAATIKLGNILEKINLFI
jgi:Zn-dependent peptidase ImmA (M78 family)